MRQIVEPDRVRHLTDRPVAVSQQLLGSSHPDLVEELVEEHSGLMVEEPTEVELAECRCASHVVERDVLRKMFTHEGKRPIDVRTNAAYFVTLFDGGGDVTAHAFAAAARQHS